MLVDLLTGVSDVEGFCRTWVIGGHSHSRVVEDDVHIYIGCGGTVRAYIEGLCKWERASEVVAKMTAQHENMRWSELEA